MFLEEDFAKRLAELRTNKKVSARDMSLSIGQSSGYINNIENGHNLPSMAVFFYICDYLGITPKEFFEIDNSDPATLSTIIEQLKKLKPVQVTLLQSILEQMTSRP